MSDAFSPQQCSIAYLKAQITHLRQLPLEAEAPRTEATLHMYEEEMQRRGWQAVVTGGGSISFQQDTARTVAGRITLLS